MSLVTVYVEKLSQTREAGAQIAKYLTFPACVYLNADMGAGKTTLCQSIVKAFGYAGEVSSPTYNLIHEYPVEQGIIYHMDLYRLDDPSELEYLAVEDLWSSKSIFLVEWPQNGSGHLREPDFEIKIRRLFEEKEGRRKIVLNPIDRTN